MADLWSPVTQRSKQTAVASIFVFLKVWGRGMREELKVRS